MRVFATLYSRVLVRFLVKSAITEVTALGAAFAAAKACGIWKMGENKHLEFTEFEPKADREGKYNGNLLAVLRFAGAVKYRSEFTLADIAVNRQSVIPY